MVNIVDDSQCDRKNKSKIDFLRKTNLNMKRREAIDFSAIGGIGKTLRQKNCRSVQSSSSTNPPFKIKAHKVDYFDSIVFLGITHTALQYSYHAKYFCH